MELRKGINIMTTTGNETIREMAAGSLAAVRVFEKFGIDYCCGGRRPLDDACRSLGLDAVQVRTELDAALAGTPASDRDWNQAPLADLVAHIVTTHHAYLQRELPAISTRLEKVYRVYNERYGPTLTGLPEVYEALRSELESHLQKEEQILFPAIINRERGGAQAPTCFGSVANPIRMMEHEHDNAGAALAEIRRITADFAVPDYACVTYKALMSGLDELERDLHMHIHLENNVLFPRAIAAE
jgi:regulator of cell morphogenesis and NO signaling